MSTVENGDTLASDLVHATDSVLPDTGMSEVSLGMDEEHRPEGSKYGYIEANPPQKVPFAREFSHGMFAVCSD